MDHQKLWPTPMLATRWRLKNGMLETNGSEALTDGEQALIVGKVEDETERMKA
jgi:hypothetical protein